MEGDVARLCDTKCKTCAMTKENNNALKQKCPSSRWHAWHKSEYHGDGDVDGARHKIGNVGVIDVDGPLHKIGKCECN
jgi:hypothetical protein